MPSDGLAAFQHMSIATATISDLPDRANEVTCHFRPQEYTFVKQNNWNPNPTTLTSDKPFVPPTFKSSAPTTLTMELLFDTNEGAGGQDVREITEKLAKMMRLKKQTGNSNARTGEPPRVEFRWGTMWSFQAVITQMTQKFTLFKPDGTPVRARVTINFLQAADGMQYPAQNPTSGGPYGHKVHIVKDGETIDWIAFEEYGDANVWRRLATANNLDDPTRLQAGQRLLLAPVK